MSNTNRSSKTTLRNGGRWRKRCWDWPKCKYRRDTWISIEISFCLSGIKARTLPKIMCPCCLSKQKKISWQPRRKEIGKTNRFISWQIAIGGYLGRTIRFISEEEKRLVPSDNGNSSWMSAVSSSRIYRDLNFTSQNPSKCKPSQ
jgi:hypothetical protein